MFPRPADRRSGFTLIELLIAVAILAGITVIVYGSVVAVADSTELARSNAEQLRFRQYVWRNFSENLGAVYSDAGCQQIEYALVGEDGSGPYGPADVLNFTTSLPMPGAASLPGVLRTVSYSVEEAAADDFPAAADGTPLEGGYLLIIEQPLVLGGDKARSDAESALGNDAVSERRIPVRSMNITYYDDEREEWVDDWDSVARSRMPWAVRVEINLARTRDQLDSDAMQGISSELHPDLDMVFALPTGAGVTGQFIDFNHVHLENASLDGSNMFDKAQQENKRNDRRR